MSYPNCYTSNGIGDVASTLLNSLGIVKGNTRGIIMKHPKF